MELDYASLLARAKSSMPESVEVKERFEIPNVRGHIEGQKTIISNFFTISETLRRKPEHLLKYLLRGLGVPADLRRKTLVIGAKVSASRINTKIKDYADEFVLCHNCGKPDTDIRKEGSFSFVVCSACGHKWNIRTKL